MATIQSTLLRIGVCCNSHRNGMQSGLVSGFDFGGMSGDGLEVRSPYVNRHLRCEIDGTTIRLGKDRLFPIVGWTRWAGNWCWDEIAVPLEPAADLMNFVRRKDYQVENARAEAYDHWNNGRRWTVAEIREWLLEG